MKNDASWEAAATMLRYVFIGLPEDETKAVGSKSDMAAWNEHLGHAPFSRESRLINFRPVDSIL